MSGDPLVGVLELPGLGHRGVCDDDRMVQPHDRLGVFGAAMGVAVPHADERLEERALLVGRSPVRTAMAGHGTSVPIRRPRRIGQVRDRAVRQVTQAGSTAIAFTSVRGGQC